MAKNISENEHNISEIVREIEKTKFYPIYLFYGDERFLIEETVNLIVGKALPDNLRQLNLEKYSCLQVDSETITTAALSIPMLSDRKVIIANDYDKINDSKALQSYLQNPSQTTILIFIAETSDKRRSVFSNVTKNGVLVKSNSLKKNEIIEWIILRFRKTNKQITPESAEILYELKGNLLLDIVTEIDKIITYANNRDTISKDDILSVIGSTREFNIFELTNSIGKSDKSRSIEILENLLEQNVEPLFIISMLSRHFIILWKIINLKKLNKNLSEISSIIQVNPYFVKDYISQAEKFNINKIEECLKYIQEADLLLKSVSLPKRIIIDNLICHLINTDDLKTDNYISPNAKVSIEI
jgi:DNA polymerase-3 subunit delta